MLFRLFRKPRRKAPVRPVRFRPSLEALEDRLTPSGGGLLDPTFGSGGPAPYNFGSLPTDRALTDVKVLSDGKLLAGGYANGDFVAARYNPDGTADVSFGS